MSNPKRPFEARRPHDDIWVVMGIGHPWGVSSCLRECIEVTANQMNDLYERLTNEDDALRAEVDRLKSELAKRETS